MNDEQLFEPYSFINMINLACANPVEQSQYCVFLSDLPKQQNSQDIFFNALSFQNLSQEAVSYLITSLINIFTERSSLINQYSSSFIKFFLEILPNYSHIGSVIYLSADLFVIAFKECRLLAKNILQSIDDDFIRGIFAAKYVSSTKSLDGFEAFFEKIFSFLTDNNDGNKNKYFMLISNVISSFSKKNIPPQIIQLIINIGPKSILSYAKTIKSVDILYNFLISLNEIINLPLSYFKMEPVRIQYLTDFIEGISDMLVQEAVYDNETIELDNSSFQNIINSNKIKFALSMLNLQLRNCPSIRSLRNSNFIKYWLRICMNSTLNIFENQNSPQATILCQCPECVEIWVKFWSLSFDFLLYSEDEDFKSYILQLIDELQPVLIGFIFENSFDIVHIFVESNSSSSFFESFSKIFFNVYSTITQYICSQIAFNDVYNTICRIKIGENLILCHLNSPEYIKYIIDDVVVISSFNPMIYDKHNVSNIEYKYSLISLYIAFINCYGGKKSETIEKIFIQNANLFLDYIITFMGFLDIPELPLHFVHHILDALNFKIYPHSILEFLRLKIDDTANKINPNLQFSILHKILVDLDLPLFYEKDKKDDAKKLYTQLFYIYKVCNSQCNKSYNRKSMLQLVHNFAQSLNNKLMDPSNVPYVLNLYECLFEFSFRAALDYYSKFLFPSIFQLAEQNFADVNIQNINLYVIRFIYNIISTCDVKNVFQFMEPQLILFMNNSLKLLSIILNNVQYDEKISLSIFPILNSYIRNKSINIGMQVSFNDFSFPQFVYQFFMNLHSNFGNSKNLSNYIHFIDLFVDNMNEMMSCHGNFTHMNQNNIPDLSLTNEFVIVHFLNFIIQKAPDIPKTLYTQIFAILNRIFDFICVLKQKDNQISESIFNSSIILLLSWKGKLDIFCQFYPKLFILFYENLNSLILPYLEKLSQNNISFVKEFLETDLFTHSENNIKEYESKFCKFLSLFKEMLL